MKFVERGSVRDASHSVRKSRSFKRVVTNISLIASFVRSDLHFRNESDTVFIFCKPGLRLACISEK